ncbi:MAG: helix-turn-helix domain-containing protein [Candidatus Omnitrophica bacterium]|nr:helix-turn-helix domain-containing protein [Candidatus Omnitrophota bacterium]
MTLEGEILTLEELRNYLKIPKPTLYSMAQSGRIPAAKVGKHWRFRRIDIDEWLKAQQWNRPLHRRHRKSKISQEVTA